MPISTVASGRRVIVTGAAGGIGRAIVATLADIGCAVAACDAPGAPVEAVPGASMTATFDVRDSGAVRQGVAGAIEALGGCDAIVANAGVVDTIHRAERFSDKEWRNDIETNLHGAFYLAQAAFDTIHGRFTDEQRTGVFKPEVEVGPSATAQEKLLAYTGRDPNV